jgi:opine dehydrogenase
MKFYKNVLECGLNSCNPVLHVGAFVLNIGRVEYQARRDFYFYEEGYTKSTSKVCEQVDRERLEIGEKFGFKMNTIVEMLNTPGPNLMACVKGCYSLTHVCGPNTTDTRYLKEDAPYGLVPWIALGRKVKASTAIMESLVNIINTIFDTNYYESGRTLEVMGLEKMDVKSMLEFVHSGTS